jgi:hypothetical protein
LIDLCKLELIVASYLRGLGRTYDHETIFELSQSVAKQSEMLIHSLIRQEVDRIKHES